MRHRIAGFHKMASSTPRAADGVITSYETRSVENSGRVKHAIGPCTRTRKPDVLINDSGDSQTVYAGLLRISESEDSVGSE